MTRTNKNEANQVHQGKGTAEAQLESDTIVKSIAAGSTHVSPPVMVDGVAEGAVTFLSKPLSTFRYVISMKDDKVSVWLEDRKTKQQWKSDELLEKEFVGSDEVIPHAKLADYVQCFHNCLATEKNDESNGFRRDLTGSSSETLELKFMLKLRLFTSEWIPSYTFKLHPVELEPVDVLNSKIRDQEEEIMNLRTALNSREEMVGVLRSEVAELKKTVSHAKEVYLVTAKTTKNTSPTQILIWQQAQSRRGHEIIELQPSGMIRFLKSGWYNVQLSVCHTNTSGAETFQLQKSGSRVDGCFGSSAGYKRTAVISCSLKVAQNDEYTVVNTGNSNVYPESSLAIHLLAPL